MFRLKSINRVCKKYNVDLWHLAIFNSKLTNLNLQLIENKLNKNTNFKNQSSSLRIDTVKKNLSKKRLSSYGQFLETRKKICYIHGGMNKSTYRHLNKLALRMQGNFSENMLYLLESRLCMLVYRLGFSKNIFESIQLIFSGQVLVNKKVVTNPNHIVSLGSIVELNFPIKVKQYNALVYRIKLKEQPYLQLSYNEINFTNMSGIIYRKPLFKEVPFSFSFSPEFFYSEYIGKL